MATNPDSRPGAAGSRSWNELVTRARGAGAPQVDVSAAVRASLARTPAPVPEPPAWWEEFARLFATPRFTGACAAAAFTLASLSLWGAEQHLSRMDPLWTFRVIGRLPQWAAHFFLS